MNILGVVVNGRSTSVQRGSTVADLTAMPSECAAGTKAAHSSAMTASFELDGEQCGTTPVRFDVLPAALRVRVPGPAPARE